MDTLEVLDASGHLTLTWNPSDPDEVKKAREDVARLRSMGYSFFAVVGSVGADEVEAGKGHLIVQRIDDPILPPEPAFVEPSGGPKTKPPKGGRRNVAVRPMAGG